MEIKPFGRMPDGTEIFQHILKTDEAEVRILNLGGIVTDFIIEGRNIVCGFSSLEDYLADDSYQGALIGRFANRIAGACFTMRGVTYRLSANEGKNTLHGGVHGFNRRVFDVAKAEENTLTLTLQSPDGEEGFPAALSVGVTYTLEGSSLAIAYTAASDGDTPVSLTNHSYFNLLGCGHPVLDFEACIHADRYTETDEALLPTGRRPLVAGTPYDLRAPRRIGEKPDGYDANFILNETSEENAPTLAATVKGGGLLLSVYTTMRHIQFYTACVLTGTPAFRGGVPKMPYTAFCLETQEEPDAPSHGGGILRAGQTYRHTTVYRVEKVN